MSLGNKNREDKHLSLRAHCRISENCMQINLQIAKMNACFDGVSRLKIAFPQTTC